jgi:hypothetical protein
MQDERRYGPIKRPMWSLVGTHGLHLHAIAHINADGRARTLCGYVLSPRSGHSDLVCGWCEEVLGNLNEQHPTLVTTA